MENINQALCEVYDIINHLEPRLYNKIPKDFIETIKENMDNTYQPKIDYSISINKQNLLKDTRIILSLIYRNYICSKEKREALKYDDIVKLKKEQEENARGFNCEDVFNKKKEESHRTESDELVEYKQDVFTKIANYIKKILKR